MAIACVGENESVNRSSLRVGVLADRNFALYCAGSAVSWMGSWAQRLGVSWLSWTLSHSPTWVGIVSLVQFLPVAVFAPVFGVLLDRVDRRRYAIAINAVLGAFAAVLFLLAQLHALTIYRLCAVAVLIGVANSAYQPARLALVNDIAPPGRLAEAIAVNSILFNLTRTLGPAVAGAVIVWLGVAYTFAVNAISYAAVIGALTLVSFVPSAPRRPSDGFLKDIWAGIQYALSKPLIRELMLLSVVTSTLGRGVLELLPAYAGGIFDRGSTGLALLTTASGAGAMLGAAVLSQAGRIEGLMASLARYGTLCVGAVLVLLGMLSSYGLAVVAMAGFGVAIVLCSVGLQTVLQSQLDVHMRGRVLGLWGACNIAGPGIGGALLGAASQSGGLREVMAASGLTCVALVMLIMRRSGHLIAQAQRIRSAG